MHVIVAGLLQVGCLAFMLVLVHLPLRMHRSTCDGPQVHQMWLRFWD